jgi:glycosyltransferase involved in cell wall biosynthesis
MDLVTLTDHDTIDGCLEIAHLPDAFISEEITTYFPEDRCKLHVLAYRITESQHDDICHLRDNVFELAAYLNDRGILHAVAHPFYAVNDRLRLAHFEKLLLLFRVFELNGARDAVLNQSLARILKGLTREQVETLADKHDCPPRMERAWEKHAISGSDDHSGLYAGTSFTEVAGAASLSEFLAGAGSGRADTRYYGATPPSLAHNIYSIVYQFYRTHFQIHHRIADASFRRFLNRLLIPRFQKNAPPVRTSQKPNPAAENDPPAPFSNELSRKLQSVSGRLLSEEPAFSENTSKPEALWFQYVQEASDAVIRDLADELLQKLAVADIFYLLSSVSTTASLYALLSPVFAAYSIFARDWRFCRTCRSAMEANPDKERAGEERIALFTDTFSEINGVAAVIRNQLRAARLMEKPLSVITCSAPEPKDSDESRGTLFFEPIGRFEMPGYPELRLFYPPVLKMLDCCYQADFTRIHAETPGPVGLAAMAVARTLNLPFHGTYHTSLPQSVHMITGDSQVEEMVWKYMLWFYGRMDRVYVPSRATAAELAGKGIPADRIRVHQWGVDTTRFHPSKKDGFLEKRYGLPKTGMRILYVGRVSREKNVALLEQVIRRLANVRTDIRLVVAGDGPGMAEMKERLSDLPAVFTGYLTGDALANVYAESDLLILPSTTDTLGQVVLEAQASATPVLVTDQGGPRENIVDGETGFVLPAHSPEQFVERILALSENPEKLAAMKESARRHMEARTFENCFLQFWENA